MSVMTALLRKAVSAGVGFALLLVVVCSASAQTRDVPEDCALRTFDREFRSLVAEGDASKLALLMNFPLRVRDEHGSYLLPDAPAFVARSNSVFTPAVRKAVLDDRSEISCKAYWHHYSLGQVHLTMFEERWAVSAVNASIHDSKRPAVRMSCWTQGHRIIVDTVGERLRLRSWKGTHSLIDKPDLELIGGSEDVEGTGPCTHTVWTFKSDATEISVSQLGCFADSNEPPAGANGHLTIRESGGDFEALWCK